MVWQLTTVDGNLVVDAAGCGPRGRCPQCADPATQVHSRYWRQISALPVDGRGLIVRLHVRRSSVIRSSAHAGRSWNRWRG
ncbi:transposase family protein [Streptomyces sp. NPDC006365]|uniref:transposase family protein n=1 Tax=Streptomyces sp. NPDC006365 TaxID=3364744 RepID=UPI0036790C9B